MGDLLTDKDQEQIQRRGTPPHTFTPSLSCQYDFLAKEGFSGLQPHHLPLLPLAASQRKARPIKALGEGLTCSASQAICLTSLLLPGAWLAPSMALSSARTCGRRAMMLVWIAMNHECAVAVSLQRRIRVLRLSGECSSISLQREGRAAERREGAPPLIFWVPFGPSSSSQGPSVAPSPSGSRATSTGRHTTRSLPWLLEGWQKAS